MPAQSLMASALPGKAPPASERPLVILLQGFVQVGLLVSVLVGLLLGAPRVALADPGICVGPVCGADFQRSALNHWQLRLRLDDQRGHHERVLVDCRDGRLSPLQGTVERGHAAAVARRVCRLAGEA
jgi:hypothetical protein